jgi:hypothetical protein
VAQFHISLDHPDDYVYMLGDKVSGKVVFDAPKSYDIKEVTIELQAKSYTSFKEIPHTRYCQARTYETNTLFETVYLFRLPKTLLARPYTLGNKLWDWPFEYSFPQRTTSTRELDHVPFIVAPHTLPPSMNAHGVGDFARVI